MRDCAACWSAVFRSLVDVVVVVVEVIRGETTVVAVTSRETYDTPLRVGPELYGRFSHRDLEVTALVELIDQVHRDKAVGGIADR